MSHGALAPSTNLYPHNGIRRETQHAFTERTTGSRETINSADALFETGSIQRTDTGIPAGQTFNIDLACFATQINHPQHKRLLSTVCP